MERYKSLDYTSIVHDNKNLIDFNLDFHIRYDLSDVDMITIDIVSITFYFSNVIIKYFIETVQVKIPFMYGKRIEYKDIFHEFWISRSNVNIVKQTVYMNGASLRFGLKIESGVLDETLIKVPHSVSWSKIKKIPLT